ncbi:MAG: MFS transporter [Pseudomonadota bacterium]
MIAHPDTETATPSLAPLFVASIVCSMGLMGFVAVAGPLADLIGLKAWQIGLTATAGGLGWVLTARAWGRAADRYGRKRILVLGLVFFIVAYMLLCLAAHSAIAYGLPPMIALAGLIATRFGMGITYSAIPAASTAVIADHYDATTRAGALGRLGAAQSSGLLLGPALVFALAGPSPALTLFILALLPMPALAFLATRLPNDAPSQAKPAPQLPLRDPRIVRSVGAAFTALIAIGIAQITIGFVAIDRLGLSNEAAQRLAGGALAAVGVSLIAAQLTVKKLGWSAERLMRVGALVSAVGFAAAAFAPTALTLVMTYVVAGFGAGWAFPAISTLAANAVDADEQGRAAGTVSSAMGLGAMIAPLIGGTLYEFASAFPYLIGAVAMAAIAIIVGRERAEN